MDPQEEADVEARMMGAYGGPARPVESAAGETMLLWALGQPTAHRQNAFVRHGARSLALDACGRRLSLLQSPSSFMAASGVTGAVVWDSGVVLAKFLEHAVDSQQLTLRGKRAVELGAGCGLVGCVAALLGADVVVTDLPDRLKLLTKNLDQNLGGGDDQIRGSARVAELVWGEDDPDPELLHPPPDFVLGSDVIYSEEAVDDLLATLNHLSAPHTTILLAGELRNDLVLECFLEAAMEDFLIGCIEQPNGTRISALTVSPFLSSSRNHHHTNNNTTTLLHHQTSLIHKSVIHGSCHRKEIYQCTPSQTFYSIVE